MINCLEEINVLQRQFLDKIRNVGNIPASQNCYAMWVFPNLFSHHMNTNRIVINYLCLNF
jgi:hypothetical protein